MWIRPKGTGTSRGSNISARTARPGTGNAGLVHLRCHFRSISCGLYFTPIPSAVVFFRTMSEIRSRIPLMKAPDSSEPNRLPSSTASLIATAIGCHSGESSYVPRRRMFRSTSVIRSNPPVSAPPDEGVDLPEAAPYTAHRLRVVARIGGRSEDKRKGMASSGQPPARPS